MSSANPGRSSSGGKSNIPGTCTRASVHDLSAESDLNHQRNGQNPIAPTSQQRITDIPVCLRVDHRLKDSFELSRRVDETFVSVMSQARSLRRFNDCYTITQFLRNDSKCLRVGVSSDSDHRKVVIKSINKRTVRNVMNVGDVSIPTEIVLHKYASNFMPDSILSVVDYFEEREYWLLVVPYVPECVDLYDFLNNSYPSNSTKEETSSLGSSDPPSDESSSASANPPRHNQFNVIRLNDQSIKHIFKQLLNINFELMKIGVVHRDLKIENILLNVRTAQIQLIDFGASALIQDREYTDFYGTPAYKTPEYILRHRYSAIPSTVWTLGIVLFDLVNGFLPFNIDEDIVSAQVRHRNEIPLVLRDIIDACLSLDPDQRPDMETLIKHHYLS